MKFVLMTIGTFSIFHAVLSLKCYNCNHPKLDFNDLQCTKPTQVECQNGQVCAKATANLYGENIVTTGCDPEVFCTAFDETFTLNINGIDLIKSCCKNDNCNGSESRFKNKAVYYILMLFPILILVFYFFFLNSQRFKKTLKQYFCFI